MPVGSENAKEAPLAELKGLDLDVGSLVPRFDLGSDAFGRRFEDDAHGLFLGGVDVPIQPRAQGEKRGHDGDRDEKQNANLQ